MHPARPYPDAVSDAVFLVPPLLLVVVLAVSAVAKVRTPRDTVSVFKQLKLPAFLLRLRAPRLLPYAELVLAAALLLAPGRWYAVPATAALLLFALYAVVILRALRLPYPVTCGCFGRLGLGEVTSRTLFRNVVLLLLALITWVDALRGNAVSDRLGRHGGALWALGGLAAVALVLLVARLVVRRLGQRPGRDSYVPVPIPDGVLHDATGPVPLWELSDRAARLLVFCDPDRDVEVVARSAAWATALAPVLVHLVTDGPDLPAESLGDPDGVLRSRLGVSSPGAVLLGTNRMLAGGPVAGLAGIEQLVTEAAEELQQAGIGHA